MNGSLMVPYSDKDMEGVRVRFVDIIKGYYVEKLELKKKLEYIEKELHHTKKFATWEDAIYWLREELKLDNEIQKNN